MGLVPEEVNVLEGKDGRGSTEGADEGRGSGYGLNVSSGERLELSPRRSSDDSFGRRVLTWPLALSTLPRTRDGRGCGDRCHCALKTLRTN